MTLLTPKEYDNDGRVLYHPINYSLQDSRKEFRKLPIKLSCDGYLIITDFKTKRGISPTFEVIPFPPHNIEKIVKIPDINLWEFEKFNRGKNEITKIERDIGYAFYFFKCPEKKAYELAPLFVQRIEDKIRSLKLTENRLKKDIQKFRNINNKFWRYLCGLKKMNCSAWLEHLKRLSEEDPNTYEDFMRKAMTPIEREYIKELRKNPLKLKEFFEGAPRNEKQLREIFNTFHYLFGFKILRCEENFPDYLLFRNGVEIRAEAELYSSRFLDHCHSTQNCDMVVCWENDTLQGEINLDIFEVGTGKIYKKDKTIEEIVVRP